MYSNYDWIDYAEERAVEITGNENKDSDNSIFLSKYISYSSEKENYVIIVQTAPPCYANACGSQFSIFIFKKPSSTWVLDVQHINAFGGGNQWGGGVETDIVEIGENKIGIEAKAYEPKNGTVTYIFAPVKGTYINVFSYLTDSTYGPEGYDMKIKFNKTRLHYKFYDMIIEKTSYGSTVVEEVKDTFTITFDGQKFPTDSFDPEGMYAY